MLALVAQAFLLGLATAPFCAAACAPVFLPVVLSREDAPLRSNVAAFAEFMLGRLLAYAAVGLLLGWLGEAVGAGPPRWAAAAAYGLLGVALLLYAVSETRQGERRERGKGKGEERNGAVSPLSPLPSPFSCSPRRLLRPCHAGSFPLLLGLLTGVNFCPPFASAMNQALRAGGALRGLAFFMAFFVATSLVTLPMAFLAFGNLVPAIRSLGRIACGAVGLIFLCAAIRTTVPAEARAITVAEVHPSKTWLQEMLPSAATFTEQTDPVRHFLGEAGGNKVGLVVFSDDLAPEVRGFNGPVPVAVALDIDGRIQSVRILPHHAETPGYMRLVESADFVGRFRGKLHSDPIRVSEDVDGVTGATYTVQAVADATRLTARRAAASVLGSYAAAAPEPGWESWRNLRHLAIFLFLGAAVIAEVRKLAWLRYVVLAASCLYLGIWLKAFFSMKQVLDIATLALPSFRAHALWYILAASALISTLFMGRLYCAYLCPFGALTELLGRVFRSPLRISHKWDRRLRRLKYGVLVAVVVAYAAAPHSGILNVEPFTDVFTLSFLGEQGEVAVRLAWLLFLAVASVLVFRFFCRYLCPAGAAMGFLAQHRLLGRRRPQGCVECGECMVSCPKRGGAP